MVEFAIRQLDETIDSVDQGWLKTQGYSALINLITLFTVLLVFTLVLQHRVYWASTLHLYGKRYKLVCILFVALIGVIIYIIYKGGRSNNRMLSLAFVVSLIMSELGAQHVQHNNPFYSPFNTPHPYLGFSGKVKLQSHHVRLAFHMGGDDAPDSITLNELGYRGPLPTIEKNKDEYRIIMLGGSTVFLGSPLEKSLPGQLESIFNEAGLRSVRVYNWGLVSGVSGQELSTIAHRAIDFDPDLIIVYNGANDSNTPMDYDPRPGFPYNYYVSAIEQRFSMHQIEPKQFMIALLRHSSAMRILLGEILSPRGKLLAQLRQQCGYDTDPWRDKIAQNYGDNLSRMATVCRGSGAKLAVFLQPLFVYKKHEVNVEKKILPGTPLLNHIRYTYPRLGVAASESLGGREEEGVYFSDISQVLNDVKKELYWDFVHVNNIGNELIAREIADRMLPVIRDDIYRKKNDASVAQLAKSPGRPQP